MEKETFREFAGADYDAWRTLAEKTLKGKPFASIITNTYENIPLQPLYTKEHMPGQGTDAAHVFPQERQPIAQELIGQTVQQALAHGQHVLHLVADAATLHGQDSDAPVRDLVLQGGLPLGSLADFESALQEADLQQHPVLLYSGYTALPLLTALTACANQQGASVRGTIGADPLAFLAETGRLPFSMSDCYDSMAAAVNWAKTAAPGVRTVFVKTDVYHNGGAHAVQELAAALAAATAYMEAQLERGISANTASESLTFGFAVGTHLFTEIAKLRAARILWDKVAECFGVSGESRKMVMHVRTSPRTKTLYDPHVNLLRTTTEAFAALVGGADTLHVGTYDEAYGGGDENGERWARNIQHILQEESRITEVIDPARGSYYVEALTAELTEQAWKLFQTIQGRGGLYAVLQEGWLQQEIEAVAKRRRQKVMSLEQHIVGTNVYVKQDEVRLKQAQAEEKLQQRVAEVIKYKEQRSVSVLAQALPDTLSFRDEAAAAVLQRAFLAGATIGEVMACFAAGEEKAARIPAMRDAEPFELLREVSERYERQTGQRPQVEVVQIGTERISVLPPVVSALQACGYEVSQRKVQPESDAAATAHAVFLAGDAEAVQEHIRVLRAKGTTSKLFVIGADKEQADGSISGVHQLFPLLYELHNELEVIV